ncbi:MAG TPA: M13 family metallopeptidase N-terminal domain-containing protein, partial [Steroidobacteraceae bacterium]
MPNRSITALAALALLAAGHAVALAASSADSPSQALPYTPGLDVSSMDRSVDACEDLYTYSCGGWQKNNPIPADQSTWSVYGKLHADNQRYLWGILEQAAKPNSERTASQQKIGDYFAACMNLDAIEQAGSAPLAPDLVRLAALTDKHALGAWIGEVHARTASTGMLFAAGVEQDARDASRVIAAVHAGGLGLPDRDYYQKADARSQAIRARYLAHVARMFELAGATQAAAHDDAMLVMRIETSLAK